MTPFDYTVHVTVERPGDKHARRMVCLAGTVESEAEAEPATFGIAATIDALQDAAEQAIEAAGRPEATATERTP